MRSSCRGLKKEASYARINFERTPMHIFILHHHAGYLKDTVAGSLYHIKRHGLPVFDARFKGLFKGLLCYLFFPCFIGKPAYIYLYGLLVLVLLSYLVYFDRAKSQRLAYNKYN